MRIEALQLERYGVFEDRQLDFSGPGLIVVYGPNEAGKSTCLSAVSDFLYGIHPQSPLGLFGYDAMRIGATLVTAAGERLELKRRKGRGKTLVDQAGAAHENSILAGVLGAVDRERFSQLFGLDHEALRVGGERLLAADGEIGRLIVEAGGGLSHLMARLDDLNIESDRLFSSRRSGDRAFYKGLDAFNDAESRLRASSLSRETFEAARKGRQQAEATLSERRTEQRELVTETSRLERLIRVAPLLTQLDRIETALADFAGLADLSTDFHRRWEAARARLRETESAAVKARAAHDELAARVEQLDVDPRFAGLSFDIQDLDQRVVLISDQRRGRSNRERELQDDEAKLAGLRDRLKVADAQALADRLPPEDAVEAIQRLALEASGRLGQMSQAELRMADAADDVAAQTAAIVQAGLAGHDKPWGVDAGAFASLASQAATVATRSQLLETGQTTLTHDFVTLGFADAEPLKAFARPDEGAIRAEMAGREHLESELTSQAAVLARATAVRDGAIAEIDRLRAGGEVATEAALGAARTTRDAAWDVVRQAYRDGGQKPDHIRAEEVERLDTGLAEADDLADRRGTEAQRIVALLDAERRQSGAEAEILAAQTVSISLTERLVGRREAFSAAFPDAMAWRPELPALLTFVADCGTLLARAADLDAQTTELARQRGELRPSLEALDAAEVLAGITPDPTASLPARIQAVVSRISAHDRDVEALARLKEALDRAEADLRSHERALAKLQEEDRIWLEAWSGPLAQLGAAPGTTPEAAAALANQWASARGVLNAIGQTRRRLQRMDEDEAELGSRVARLAAALDISVPQDIVAGAQIVIARWRTQDRLRSDRAALEPELAAASDRLETADRALAAAQAEMSALAAEAKAAPADPKALEDLAERARQRQSLVEAEKGLLDQARSAGDGLDIGDLRSQQGERDVDALKGGLAAKQSRLAEVEGEAEVAILAAQAAKLELEGFELGHDANRALADRESATASLHATLERYVEVRLARDLVTAAIARVRATQQDPLVRRAGALFAAMTQGRFSGVDTDIDDKGVPVVVGRRTGGGIVPVAAMSDGSRDQLFLSFRLASLEVYGESAEPLPFIADDILVHFDDARSAATLELLAEFSSRTQILLFTHHKSVRDAAMRLKGADLATIVELERAS